MKDCDPCMSKMVLGEYHKKHFLLYYSLARTKKLKCEFCSILVTWNWCMSLWWCTFLGTVYTQSLLEPGSQSAVSMWSLCLFYMFKPVLRCSLLANLPFKFSTHCINRCYVMDKCRSKWS